jgi:tetratricopeptide (TPR) repeat protein
VLGDLFVGQYPRLARASYETADRLKPDEPAVLLGLSKCAQAVGDLGEAAALASRAVRIDGNRDIRFGQHLASVLLAQRKFAESQRVAEADLAAIRDQARDSAGTRITAEKLDGQYRLLIDILQKHVEADPGAVGVYLDLARYMRLQVESATALSRYDALRVLQRGVEQSGAEAPVALLEQYAIALADVERTEDAVVQFEAILARDPANVIAKEWLGRLRAGTANP